MQGHTHNHGYAQFLYTPNNPAACNTSTLSTMYLQVQQCRLWVQVTHPQHLEQPAAAHNDRTSTSPPPEWVLLMHGFPDTADMWRDQVSALSAAGYAVVAPDMPGFGGSAFEQQQGRSAEDDIKQYRLRNIVSIMCGMLDQLGISRAAVVGHDWGAAVAWTLAMQASQRCSRLVVLSVGHPGES